MYKTTLTSADAETVPGTSLRYPITERTCGATNGAVGYGELDAGVEVPVHRHGNAEEASFVLQGTGSLLTAEGEFDLNAGDLIFAPRDAWHGIRAGDEQLRVLVVLGGLGHPSALATEPLKGDATDEAPPITLKHLEDSEEFVVHEPARGFFHFKARWGLDGDTAGATTCMLMQSSSEAGRGKHVLHRHPGGDEFAFFLDGSDLVHLTQDGEEATKPGDLTFTPAGEWHGAENRGTRGLALFGFLGANSLDAAGYELYERSDRDR